MASLRKRYHGQGDQENDDEVPKVKRSYSDIHHQKYADIVIQTDIDLTLGEQGKEKKKQKGKKEKKEENKLSQHDRIMQMICSLRNSGGGILQMRIINIDLQGFDKFHQSLRNNLKRLVKDGEVFGDVFDDRGTKLPDYLSLPFNERILELYVKPADFLCFTETHAKETHEFSVEPIGNVGVRTLLHKRCGDCHNQEVKFPALPCVDNFVYETETDLREGQCIQLKEITEHDRETSLTGKLFESSTKSLVPRYLVGFANNKGGHLFIGIAEHAETGKKEKTGRSRCVGVRLTDTDKQEIKDGLIAYVKKLKCCPVLKSDSGSDFVKYMNLKLDKHVKLEFYPVHNQVRVLYPFKILRGPTNLEYFF